MYISVMSSKKHYVVGFLREHPRHARGPQEAALGAAGAGQVYTSVPLLLRHVREGDAVAITHAHLLAEPEAQAGTLRDSFRSALDRIHKREAHVWELSTGLRTNNPKQCILIERAATDALARSRVYSRNGRPPRDWSDKAENIRIESLWRNLKYRTNRDAVAAMKVEGIENVSVSVVSKRFGPSGRAERKLKRR
jgi:hypothetical protein